MITILYVWEEGEGCGSRVWSIVVEEERVFLVMIVSLPLRHFVWEMKLICECGCGCEFPALLDSAD